MNTNFKPEHKVIAQESLDMFAEIERLASAEIHSQIVSHKAGVFATINPLTTATAMRTLENAQKSVRAHAEYLVKEPCIYRVKVRALTDEREKLIYIARGSVSGVSPSQMLAGYKSEVGRIAELDIYDNLTLPELGEVEVLEKVTLDPKRVSDGWDSHKSVVYYDAAAEIMPAFRALVSSQIKSLDDLLSEESDAQAQAQGIRHNAISAMSLRDQPTLDKIQGEIFRLDINTRLFLMGPPGTGKTTTLIKRLGQKLDVEFLNKSEKRLIEQMGPDHHAENWLMFTPNDLLKVYLKEAFNREQVPASDHQLKTWVSFRKSISKNELSLLNSEQFTTGFILETKAHKINYFSADHSFNTIDFYEDFVVWQHDAFLNSLALSLEGLKNSTVSLEMLKIIEDADKALKTYSRIDAIDDLLLALYKVGEPLASILENAKSAVDKEIKSSLNLLHNSDARFIDLMATEVLAIQKDAEIVDEDDEDELDDEDVVATLHNQDRNNAVAFYNAAIKAYAKSIVNKKSLSKKSKYGRLIIWLDKRLPSTEKLEQIGNKLNLLKHARSITSAAKIFFLQVSKRFRSFRKFAVEQGRWYAQLPDNKRISALELDMLVLFKLFYAKQLLNNRQIHIHQEKSYWSPLATIGALLKTQVLVDEATDFSPIQLASMANLTDPRSNSFFACGDFNQRLTSWGTRSKNELKWILKDIQIREISVAYRQSEKLMSFSAKLLKIAGEKSPSLNKQKFVQHVGYDPVLLTNSPELEEQAKWLAERLKEIERILSVMPSVAIFVNTETEIAPLHEALEEQLEETNISVQKCLEGQTAGDDENVRIFSIEHIKGLEFEAVFYIGIDRLAQVHPNLIDKYLYVGATRAATFLGMTCYDQLPDKLLELSSNFVKQW